MLAIAHGTVYTPSDGFRSDHTVLIRQDVIEAVVAGHPPPGGRVVDATGRYVLPGLIDARTSVGLYGDGSGAQHADHEELTDPDSAWVRAVDAINPADPAFADAREAGVTTLLAGP
ncbi:MAG: amidohydrolase, partial [Anaerolineae bacterium]